MAVKSKELDNLREELRQLNKEEIRLKRELRTIKVKQQVVVKRKKVVKQLIEKKEVQQQIIQADRRIRKQIVISYVNSKHSPYFISIRAVTINPEITMNGLKMAVVQAKNKIEKSVNLGRYREIYTAPEIEEIATNEDRALNDFKVHVVIIIEKRIAERYTI